MYLHISRDKFNENVINKVSSFYYTLLYKVQSLQCLSLLFGFNQKRINVQLIDSQSSTIPSIDTSISSLVVLELKLDAMAKLLFTICSYIAIGVLVDAASYIPSSFIHDYVKDGRKYNNMILLFIKEVNKCKFGLSLALRHLFKKQSEINIFQSCRIYIFLYVIVINQKNKRQSLCQTSIIFT